VNHRLRNTSMVATYMIGLRPADLLRAPGVGGGRCGRPWGGSSAPGIIPGSRRRRPCRTS
jgi:hypothetical protein